MTGGLFESDGLEYFDSGATELGVDVERKWVALVCVHYPTSHCRFMTCECAL
jgi:hypothetical protein